MKILSHILAGSAPVIALVMALHLDARDDQIARLTLDRDTAQAKAINARNDADFPVSYTHLTLPTIYSV